MELTILVAGLACIAYTVAEISAAAARRAGSARFGAVEADSGRPLDVTLDRRTADRRASRRAMGGIGVSIFC